MIELSASNKTLEVHDAVVNGMLLRNIGATNHTFLPVDSGSTAFYIYDP